MPCAAKKKKRKERKKKSKTAVSYILKETREKNV